MNRAATPIRVDRSSPVPLYFQVAQHLEQMIESGELPMGTWLERSTYDEQGTGGGARPPRLPGVAVQLRPHPGRLVIQVTRAPAALVR